MFFKTKISAGNTLTYWYCSLFKIDIFTNLFSLTVKTKMFFLTNLEIKY
jgi:hypothetical protein